MIAGEGLKEELTVLMIYLSLLKYVYVSTDTI
jgi:hypothetical protein